MSDDHQEDDSLETYWDDVRVKSDEPRPAATPSFSDRVGKNDLVIGTSRERILVIVKADGTLEYGPEYTPDEAAVTFWEAMGRRRLEMEDRLLVIQHMEGLLTRLGRQDMVVETLRRGAQDEENPQRKRALELRAADETRRLEMYVHQTLELGRGLARRPEVNAPQVPEQVPASIQNNENSDYQGREGLPSEPGERPVRVESEDDGEDE